MVQIGLHSNYEIHFRDSSTQTDYLQTTGIIVAMLKPVKQEVGTIIVSYGVYSILYGVYSILYTLTTECLSRSTIYKSSELLDVVEPPNIAALFPSTAVSVKR